MIKSLSSFLEMLRSIAVTLGQILISLKQVQTEFQETMKLYQQLLDLLNSEATEELLAITEDLKQETQSITDALKNTVNKENEQ